MKQSMSLQDLFDKVMRQSRAKRDLLADTSTGLRMVQMPDTGALAIVTLNGGEQLERFDITRTAHDQIAEWLDMPRKYYDRVMNDHRDLLCQNVNTLFEREPGMRMVRTLDGKVRAFLSNRYRRLDNDAVLQHSLPAILNQSSGVPANKVLRSYIGDNDMRIAVVFTDPALQQTIGVTKDGNPDIINPGFELSNSETGKGSLKFRGFFYRGYCDNGCIWSFGDEDFSMQRNHVGGKLAANMLGEILSDEAKQADDRALILAIRDCMKAIGTVEVAQKLGDALRAARNSGAPKHIVAAVSVLANEVGLTEGESNDVLRNLIADADFSRYGMLNAVTAVANADETTQERAFELEAAGNQILNFSQASWDAVVNATATVKVAIAA